MGQMKGKDKQLESAFAWDWFPEYKRQLMVAIYIDAAAMPVTEILPGLSEAQRLKLLEVLTGAVEALNDEDDDDDGDDRWVTTPGGAKLRADIDLDDMDDLRGSFLTARDAVDGEGHDA